MPQRMVYLDHNATTPLHPEVKRTLQEAMDVYGNPSSLHSFGRQARKRIEDARYEVASFIGAAVDEIVFVGSGSEANNTVLNLCSCHTSHCTLHCAGRKDIITTRIEHPCILEASRCLVDRGVSVRYLDVDQYGKIKLEQLESMLSENKTALVSVMMANNEIGTIQDIKAVSRFCRKYGSLVHTDAVQAAGKIPVNVNDLDVDFLTISGHKIYGPKGVGVLFTRKGVPFCPLIRGGHQERFRRAGTENTLGIIGLGKAVVLRRQEMDSEWQRLSELKKSLRVGLEKSIPDIQFNGHPVDCLAGTLNVSFDGVEGEAVLLYLDLEGIAVSTGSACASGSLDPSHVLLAAGLPAERAHSSIRMSLGRDTTSDDIQYVVDRLPVIIKKIRGMSTAYKSCR